MPAPLCPSCDFDLRAHDASGVCPECGAAYASNKQPIARWTIPRIVWMALLCTAVSVLFIINLLHLLFPPPDQTIARIVFRAAFNIWMFIGVLTTTALLFACFSRRAPTGAKRIAKLLFYASVIMLVGNKVAGVMNALI